MVILAVSAAGLFSSLSAHSPSAQGLGRVEGKVHDSGGKPVAGASVYFLLKGAARRVTVRTNSDGTFEILALPPGEYSVWAKNAFFGESAVSILNLREDESRRIELTLHPPSPSTSAASRASANFEFKDEPDFKVAGLADWSSPGGHGSDVQLRAAESLTRHTMELKPDHPAEIPGNQSGSAASAGATAREKELKNELRQDPQSFAANQLLGELYLGTKRFGEAIPYLKKAAEMSPGDFPTGYDLALAYNAAGNFKQAQDEARKMLTHQKNADLYRLLGGISERINDPLAAEREYEQAVRLDPSEQNYFSWGTELLYHRAIVPARQVFAQGSRLHRKSARLLMGLGVALYAQGATAEAARQLGKAMGLDPASTDPCVFLGKMVEATREPIPGAGEILARFLELYPDNAQANYYEAVSLWKQQRVSNTAANTGRIEALLRQAVQIDPKLSQGYVQLGNIFSDQRKYSEAVEAYQKSLEIDPGLEEAHFRLATAYERLGEETNAREEIQAYRRIHAEEAAKVDRQRRNIRQFVIALKNQHAPSTP